MIKLLFPGALSNDALEARVIYQLSKKGYRSDNTLLATSLCCDELARQLESDFVKVYGKNFNLGGLAGFPFAGNTGFGAMAAHIPDDGSVLIVYGPHVGVATTGGVGKVERAGIALVDNCCGSAIAASNYLKGICETGLPPTTNIQQFTDFQQVRSCCTNIGWLALYIVRSGGILSAVATSARTRNAVLIQQATTLTTFTT